MAEYHGLAIKAPLLEMMQRDLATVRAGGTLGSMCRENYHGKVVKENLWMVFQRDLAEARAAAGGS